jgi:para-aminobenzoate synthetase component 1
VNFPLIEEIPNPLSAVETFFLFKNEPYSFFLDSSMYHSQWGRYSFIGSDPFLIFRSKDGNIEIQEGERLNKLRGNPFDILKIFHSRYSLPSLVNFPPFIGGTVGYFGYDLCHHLEELPSHTLDDLSLPDCYLGFYDCIIAFDHQKGRSWIISCGFPELNKTLRETRAKIRLAEIKNRISCSQEFINSDMRADSYLKRDLSIISNFSKEGYLDAVQKAKDYIAQGDIFQVNLSQRLCVEEPREPFELYCNLRSINPTPFASFLNFAEVKIISASPERFLRIEDRKVQTRPIKGTRPRGREVLEDNMFAMDLLESEKDRAELVMIVDVERNDLGRVCEYGTVKVPELVTLETYATVFHLVSTVEGTLRQDKDHIDCLKASFPGGSITGAPKIRAMEIIDELEPTKRSVYTGSIGYLGFNKQTDLNIVIRTFLITKRKAYFQVGGGIVTDSDPEAEYAETLHKAKSLIDACPVATGQVNLIS